MRQKVRLLITTRARAYAQTTQILLCMANKLPLTAKRIKINDMGMSECGWAGSNSMGTACLCFARETNHCLDESGRKRERYVIESLHSLQ